MKKQTKKLLLISSIILSIIAISFFLMGFKFDFSGTFNIKTLSVAPGGGTIKYMVPIMGAYKCEVTQDKMGLSVNIPNGGALISKSTVGFYTNGVTNLQISAARSMTVKRVRYSICDTNGDNCGVQGTMEIAPGTTKPLTISGLDFTRESMRIYSETQSFPDVWHWEYWAGMTLQYNSRDFGLRAYDIHNNPAGAPFCDTSCALTCPDIGVRQNMVIDGVSGGVINFYDSKPYFIRWDEINYDANMQGGAPIYSNGKFCFSGTVYNAKTSKVASGDTYVYPDPESREYKTCCPGAKVSATYSDAVCQSDYTWKIVADTDQLTCTTAFNCPGIGGKICQNKMLSSGYTCSNKDINGIGLCIKSPGQAVSCCISSDCPRDMTCSSENNCVGGSSLPTCGDSIVQPPEQCDLGNRNGLKGEKCTSACTKVCEGNNCGGQSISCKTCGSWFTSLFKKQENKCIAGNVIATKWYNPFTWVVNIFGLAKQSLLCPIFLAVVFFAFIFSVLFGKDIFERFNAINRYPWLVWTLTLIIAFVIAWLVYSSFMIGVIVLIIYVIFRALLSGTLRKIKVAGRRLRK